MFDGRESGTPQGTPSPNTLLVRVGADATEAGGRCHGVVDSKTREFVYVPIPEARAVRAGLETSYAGVADALARFGRVLPETLTGRSAHLDPDFEQLTYGDRALRAGQIRANLGPGDSLVFYASLRDVHRPHALVYALIGALVVDRIVRAVDISACTLT